MATESSDGGTLFIAAADGTDLSSFTSRMEGHSFSGLVIAHNTTIDGNHIIRGTGVSVLGNRVRWREISAQRFGLGR